MDAISLGTGCTGLHKKGREAQSHEAAVTVHILQVRTPAVPPPPPPHLVAIPVQGCDACAQGALNSPDIHGEKGRLAKVQRVLCIGSLGDLELAAVQNQPCPS